MLLVVLTLAGAGMVFGLVRLILALSARPNRRKRRKRTRRFD